jgi:hypothetical protein
MSHPFSTQTTAVDNEKYNSLISELNNEVIQEQPEDLLQFCTTFFQKKLQLEREESRHPSYHHHDQHPLCKCLFLLYLFSRIN